MAINQNPRRSQRLAAQKRQSTTQPIKSAQDSATTNKKHSKAKSTTKATDYIVSEASDSESGTETDGAGVSNWESSLGSFIAHTDDDCCSSFSYDSRCASGNEDYELNDFVTDEDCLSKYSSAPASETEGDICTVVPAKRKRRVIRRKAPMSGSSVTSDEESSSALPPNKKRRLVRINRCIESSSESDTDEGKVVRPKRGRPIRSAVLIDDIPSDSNNIPNSPEFPSPSTGIYATNVLSYPTPMSSIPSQPSRSNSTSSNLFFTDSEPPRRPSTCSSRSSGRTSSLNNVMPSHWFSGDTQAFVSDDPDEIVAFIHNGIATFSQRFDESQTPSILTLSEAVRDDYRVREALRDAVRLRLAKMVDGTKVGVEDNGGDENEMWILGPVQRKSLSGYIV